MKTRLTMALVMGLAAALVQADDKDILKDSRAKASYGIGANLGTQWRQQEVDIDIELLLRGLKDALAGKETLMTEAEIRQTLSTFQQEHRRLRGERNKERGEKFLAENKTKEGVKALPSGLQYKVQAEGSGELPKATDTVTVNYRGTFIDGTEFDSSYKRGQPYTTSLNGVIKGWTEAIQLMKPGAKWQLFIPADLAYGERGWGSQIGPNTALIFEIELISAAPAPKPAATSTNQPVVTSDIIKVPSKEELEKGAKIEILKPEDVERIQKQEAEKKKQQEQQKKQDKK